MRDVYAALVVALFMGTPGVLMAAYPRTAATARERLDAIGSERSIWEVEAAEWNVTLTRHFGIVWTVVAALIALTISPWP